MPVTQADEERAIIAFDDVLGNAGSYAEFGRPSYREGGVRTLSQAFAAYREAALDEAANEAYRIGVRWAEDATCPETSRQVGLQAHAAILALKANPHD